MASANFTWTLEAFEQQGNLWLKWSQTAPFRAQQGQIHVYSGDHFPSDPTKETKAWSWDNEHKPSWDTGLKWGTGWHCAYIAEASPNGPYKYFIQLITTATQGPDIAKK